MTAWQHKQPARLFRCVFYKFPIGSAVGALCGPVLLCSGCVCNTQLRPSETQVGRLYSTMQVYEAKLDAASGQLDRGRHPQPPTEALRDMDAAISGICYTAGQIREPDADLRCQMARRRRPQIQSSDDEPLD